MGEPARWPGCRQLYRASGLSPIQYESAGRRRDGSISREGSVELRRALIELGIGLWHCDPSAKRYGQTVRERGNKGGVIACAMANRVNRIAFALVRDHAGYDPSGPEQHREASEERLTSSDMRAIFYCWIWKLAIGLPNCSRVVA